MPHRQYAQVENRSLQAADKALQSGGLRLEKGGDSLQVAASLRQVGHENGAVRLDFDPRIVLGHRLAGRQAGGPAVAGAGVDSIEGDHPA